jgi:hypothetical protein
LQVADPDAGAWQGEHRLPHVLLEVLSAHAPPHE